MKTRSIYGKKNKTVSKRNTKSKKPYAHKRETRRGGKKRVYRRKTMKGGDGSALGAKFKWLTNPELRKLYKKVREADKQSAFAEYIMERLLSEEIANMKISYVLTKIFNEEPIKRFSSMFYNEKKRQLEKIKALDVALKNFEDKEFKIEKGLTADEIENSSYCRMKKEDRHSNAYKLCEYIPHAMKFLQRKMKDQEQAKRDVGDDVSPQTIRFGKRNGSFRFYWITQAEIDANKATAEEEKTKIIDQLNVLIKDCKKVQLIS